MTDYAANVWDCGVCGNRGPWFLTLWWREDLASYPVPGGRVTVWVDLGPVMAVACSEKCARQWAQHVGSARISITRPERDDWHRQQSADWSKRQQRQGWRRRAA